GILAHVGIEGFLGVDALVEAGEDLQSEAERWFITNWWSRYRRGVVGTTNLLEVVNQPGSPVLELWGLDARPESYDKRTGQLIRSIKDKTFTVPGTDTGGPGATVRVRRCDNDS